MKRTILALAVAGALMLAGCGGGSKGAGSGMPSVQTPTTPMPTVRVAPLPVFGETETPAVVVEIPDNTVSITPGQTREVSVGGRSVPIRCPSGGASCHVGVHDGSLWYRLDGAIPFALASLPSPPPTPTPTPPTINEQLSALLVAADWFDFSFDLSDGPKTMTCISEDSRPCTARTQALERVSDTYYTSEGIYRGVNMARGSGALSGGESSIVYGGWLDYISFQIEEIRGGIRGGDSYAVEAFFAGQYSRSGRFDGVTYIYNGVMVGMDSSGLSRTQYRGDVRMEYTHYGDRVLDRNGSSIDADVTISNILNRSTNSLDGRTLSWDNMRGGTPFGVRSLISSSNYIWAMTFGPNEEEAGAVFEQQGITGAFGAKLTPASP